MGKQNESADGESIRFDTNFHNDLRFVWHYSKEAQKYHKQKRLEFPIRLGFQDKLLDTQVEYVFCRHSIVDFLKRNKINTVGQLLEHWNSLLKLRNCGVTKFTEIRNTFLAWYYDQLSEEQKKEFWKKVFW